jgi:ParB/RepB/Spo0J family partition protein
MQTTLPPTVPIPDPKSRTYVDAVADALLTDSILQHGILQPPGVRKDGADFLIVWGHRRVRCAVAAGLKSIPVIVLDRPMTEGEFLILQWTENAARQDLSGYEQWQAAERLLSHYPKWSNADLAKALSLDPSSVTRILAARNTLPEVQEAFRKNLIGLKCVYDISKAKSEDQPPLLAAKLAGNSGNAVGALGLKARKRAAHGPRVGRIKCQAPDANATVVVSGDGGLDLLSMIEVMQQIVRRAKRAAEQGWDCKTFERACRDEYRLRHKAGGSGAEPPTPT